MPFSKTSDIAIHNSLVTSLLFDEHGFYEAFANDLLSCQNEAIIESPFITSSRVALFSPIFQTLLKRQVNIYILTRDPKEHDEKLEIQAEQEITKFENMGIHTYICKGNDHRKLAILDRKILWEGSLNILSQTRSREIMRRITGKETAEQMFDFLNLGKYI